MNGELTTPMNVDTSYVLLTIIRIHNFINCREKKLFSCLDYLDNEGFLLLLLSTPRPEFHIPK